MTHVKVAHVNARLSAGPPIKDVIRMLALPGAMTLLAGVLATLVARAVAPVSSSDTYFHLRLGDEFLGDWTARSTGSVTRFATADWVPTQWLSQVVMASTSSTFGLPGIAWLTGLMLLSYAAVLYGTARRRVGPLTAVLITTLAIVASFPALSGRPQVLSYIFTALVTATWLNAHRTHRVPWWLVPLMWLWAMIHGMWITGVVISTVASVGIVVGSRGLLRPMPWLAVPLLGAISAALTPVGPALYSGIFRVGSISDYFAEWAPPDFTKTPTAMAALLVAVLVTLLFRSKHVSWFTIGMVLLTCAWLAWTSRTVPVAAAMASVLLAEQIAHSRARPVVRRLESTTASAVFIGAIAALTFIVPQTASMLPDEGNKARASVHDLPLEAGLLNEWDNGGTDMWLHPHLNIVMHGYGDMFTDAELDRNIRLHRLDPGWQDDLDSLQVNDALLEREGRLATVLVDLLNWKVIAEDDGLAHLRAPRE